MKPKHTPGPWQYEKDTAAPNHEIVIYRKTDYAPEKAAIAKLNPFLLDEREANAERIVACVNAMEGIDDPAAARAILDDPRTQAASDMLGALKEVSEALLLTGKVSLRKRIENAIAKAEG